jgi:hypothetical protein
MFSKKYFSDIFLRTMEFMLQVQYDLFYFKIRAMKNKYLHSLRVSSGFEDKIVYYIFLLLWVLLKLKENVFAFM